MSSERGIVINLEFPFRLTLRNNGLPFIIALFVGLTQITFVTPDGVTPVIKKSRLVGMARGESRCGDLYRIIINFI
jgi:hypothetical protein